MPQIDIKIGSKFDPTGFNQLKAATSGAGGSIAGFGAKLGIGILGAQNALSLLKNEITHVISEIDKIPGIPQATIDSVNQAKFAVADTRAQIDRLIAAGVAGFANFGQRIGNFYGAVLMGSDVAAEGARRLAAEAKAAATAVEDAKKAKERATELEKLRGDIAKGQDDRRSPEDQLANGKAYLAVLGTTLSLAAALRKEGKLTADDELAEARALAAREATLKKIAAAESQIRAEQDKAFSRKTAELEIQRAEISSNNLLTVREKNAEILPLLQRENALITERIALKQQEATLSTDSKTVAALQDTIDRLQKELASNRGQIAGIQNPETLAIRGAKGVRDLSDPSQHFQSVGEGVVGASEQFVTQVGTLGDQTAQVLNTSLSGATTGLATAFEGLLNRTMTWGDALRNIWVNFGGSMVAAFSKMAAEYLVSKTLMFTIDTVFAAKSLALSVASAAKSLVAWIPSAIAASISSYGIAAAIGVAAVIAAIASGGFAEGGFTSSGPKNKPAGIVHAGEWVSPQWMVDHPIYGPVIAALEGARNGAPGFLDGGMVDPVSVLTRPGFEPTSAQSGGTSGVKSTSGRSMTVIAHFDKDDVRRSVRDADGEAWVIDVLNKNRHVFGI